MARRLTWRRFPDRTSNNRQRSGPECERGRQTDYFEIRSAGSFCRVWSSPIDVHNNIINYPAKRTRQERVLGTKHTGRSTY